MKALKIQNVGFNTVTVYLKDTKSVEPFIEETKNKIKIGSVDDVVQTDENGIRSSVKPMVISQQDLESGEWSYQLIRNKEWYEMVAKPVEKLNRLIGYMIVGFVTAGILLFGRHVLIEIPFTLEESIAGRAEFFIDFIPLLLGNGSRMLPFFL